MREPFSQAEERVAWNTYFNFGYCEKPEQLYVVLIKEMHWTYQQFLEQPTWLVNSLITYMQAESEHIKNSRK